MAIPSSPFAFLNELISKDGKQLQPPAWAVHEVQHRAVLFLNHVLQQEPQAQERLRRHVGRVVMLRWRNFAVALAATPAGLVDLAPEGAVPDLTLSVIQESPFDLARASMAGDKPAVRIVGDVQLAAEVNWLVDHVRWDVEEDLARVIGDTQAHAIGNVARKLVDGLRQFIDKAARSRPTGPKGPADTE